MSRISMLAGLVALVACGTVSQALAQDDILAKVPQKAMGVIVIRGPSTLDAQLTDLLKRVVPMQNGQQGLEIHAFADLLAKFRVSPEQFDTTAPMAVWVMAPADRPERPVSGVLVKPRDFQALVGEAPPDVDGIYTFGDDKNSFLIRYDDYVLVASFKDLQGIKGQPLGFAMSPSQQVLADDADVYGMVDLAALKVAGEPQFQKLRAKLATSIEEAKALGEDGAAEAAQQESVLKLLDDAWVRAGELRWIGFSFGVSPAGLDFQVRGSADPEGRIGHFLSGHPVLGETLAPNLPVDGLPWVAGWYSLDMPRVIDAYKSMLAVVEPLCQTHPQLAQLGGMIGNLNGLMEKAGGLGQVVGPRVAFAAYAVPNGPLMGNMVSATEVKDAEACRTQIQGLMEAYQKLIDDLAASMPADAPKMGVVMQYVRDVRKVGDLSVDNMIAKFQMPQVEGNPPGMNPNDLLKSVYGSDGLSQWIAFADGHMLTVTGDKPDRIADLAAAVKLKEGGLAGSPQIAAAMKKALPEANTVVCVSAATYLDTIADVMAKGAGVTVPPAAPPAAGPELALSVVSMAMARGEAALKVHVPLGDMQRSFMSFMRLQMAAQQMQMKMQEEMRRRMQEQQERQERQNGAPKPAEETDEGDGPVDYRQDAGRIGPM
ncbi:MAG TPA: hypothetical protein PLP01_00725 [Phycisphaerae bacterium]|nr:hypothetical protein [Phycisphaerae bacterium]